LLTASNGVSPNATQIFTLTIHEVTLQSISVTPSPGMVAAGDTLQFTATGHYSDGSTADITNSVAWNSSDPTKAPIDVNGRALGIAAGTTDITATQGSVTSTPAAMLTVTAPVVTLQSITVTPSPASVTVGGHVQFTATGHYSDGSTANLTN